MLAGNNNTNDDLVMDSTDDLDDLNDDTNDLENNSKCKESGDGGCKNSPELNEDDKRKRRAIANSNERRRMQSINAGFQTLKNLIPHSSGEKLSKACILQRSADYMQFLNKEKEKLNCRLQMAVKLIESHGLLSELQQHVGGLDEHDSHRTGAVKSECQKICSKRKSLSSISSLLRSDESRQLTDSTNRPSVKCSEPEDAEKIKTRSSSIDQLIAAAAVASSSPSSSSQPSNSACDEPPKKNLNLNTIFEAIKHVEGGRTLEQPDVNKPPKKRKYTVEESAQANSAASMCYIDLKQLNALCLNQNQMQPTQLAILTSNENKNSTDEQSKKKNDKIIGLLVTSS